MRGFFLCTRQRISIQLPLRRTLVLHIFAEQMISGNITSQENLFVLCALQTQFFEL